ncbi:YwbE family protein [Bacillus sp. 165]|uniref:YwbE family protein n=1 Tax=Bacillus sp. 165 TaxID=1529117 RepID=UPI001ADAE6F1|nr:YwbE family protein [Bacillus sp. 165]MBO9131213.1 YwbE family protein [Bacillus sp. 165]
MNGQYRTNISPGLSVSIVLKADQKTGKTTNGIVKDILTKSSFHPHGIKVRLQDGQVGRVKEVLK